MNYPRGINSLNLHSFRGKPQGIEPEEIDPPRLLGVKTRTALTRVLAGHFAPESPVTFNGIRRIAIGLSTD